MFAEMGGVTFEKVLEASPDAVTAWLSQMPIAAGPAHTSRPLFSLLYAFSQR